MRLYNLHEPQTPVYDETHVGRFLNWYHERAFFFDVVCAPRALHESHACARGMRPPATHTTAPGRLQHGPLSKLMMHWTATRLGFAGRASCPYESSAPYAARCELAPQVRSKAGVGSGGESVVTGDRSC